LSTSKELSETYQRINEIDNLLNYDLLENLKKIEKDRDQNLQEINLLKIEKKNLIKVMKNKDREYFI